ncbi:MAG: glycosyltransferase family 39 protein [Bryobacteraceae bacterium]
MDILQLPGKRRDAFVIVCLLAVIAATRWPLAPDHLFFFDSINFALALEEFNPALHQPQPPGYPMFVALTRLLHLGIPSPEAVFLIAGILGAAGAAYFLWRLAGTAAVVLFVFHPVLIFGGLTNQVRVFYAFAGCGAAWLAWRAWISGHARTLLPLGAFLGLAAGFRPTTALLLFPLLAAAMWRHRGAPRTAACALLLYIAGICCWLLPVVNVSGGMANYVALIRGYANEQFGSSLFYDAPPSEALRMAAAAIVWPGLGSLAWIWAVPLADRNRAYARLRPLAPILALWFIPALLFFSLVHVADPDQSLLMAPVYCVLGGLVIETVIEQRGWRRLRPLLLLALAAFSFYLFLRPPRGIARATGYGVIRYMQRRSSGVFDSLAALRSRGPVQILVYQPELTWRKIAYYERPLPVYVVEGSGHPVWLAQSADRAELPRADDGAYRLRQGQVAVVMGSSLAPERESMRDRWRFREQGPVLWRWLAAGDSFELAGVRFVTVP